MTKLVLIRHGRSTANADGVLAGRAPGVFLDDTGRAQAEALRDVFAGVKVSAVYTSPIQRCVETATLAGFPDAILLEGMSECDYGEWTGRKLADLAQQQVWADIQAKPTEVSFPGGESMTSMFDRVGVAIEEVAARHGKDEVVVVFSHGDPIKAVIAHAFGMDRDDFQRVHVSPAGVSVIHYGEPYPRVLCVNVGADVAAHLAAPTGAVVGGGDVAKA